MSKKILRVDSQILTMVQQCALRTKMRMVDCLEPTNRPPSFDIGSYCHKVLEVYGQGKINGDSKNEIIMRAFEGGHAYAIEHEIGMDELNLGYKTMQEYFTFYSNETWIWKSVETPFTVPLFENDDILIVWEGIIDCIVDAKLNDEWLDWTVDHKTTSRNREPVYLTNQFEGYAFARGNNRLIINTIGTQKTLEASKKFRREYLRIPQEVIDEWKAQAIHWSLMWAHYLETGYFPASFSACDGKFGPCIYYPICWAKHQDREYVMRAEYVVGEEWDPYKKK